MILGPDGKPIYKQTLVNDLMRRIEASSKRMSDSAFEASERMSRVIRFRMVNGLPLEFNAGSFLDSGVSWDGRNYSTYGDIVQDSMPR